MALLFEVDRTRITRHIKNIFEELELEEKSNVRKTHFPFSDKDVTIYNLEVVIAVGYRVKSKRGILLKSAFFTPLLTMIVQLIKKKKSPERFNHLNTFLKTNNLYVYTQRYDCLKFLLVERTLLKPNPLTINLLEKFYFFSNWSFYKRNNCFKM